VLHLTLTEFTKKTPLSRTLQRKAFTIYLTTVMCLVIGKFFV